MHQPVLLPVRRQLHPELVAVLGQPRQQDRELQEALGSLGGQEEVVAGLEEDRHRHRPGLGDAGEGGAGQ